MTMNDWQLLKEIKKVKKFDDDKQNNYWHDRFNSLDIEQDTNLRGKFESLEQGGYIDVFWADNIPYYLTLTEKGKSFRFFTDKLKSCKPLIKWIFGILATVIASIIISKLLK